MRLQVPQSSRKASPVAGDYYLSGGWCEEENTMGRFYKRRFASVLVLMISMGNLGDRLNATYMDKESNTTHPTAITEQTPTTSTPMILVSQHKKKSPSSAPSTSASIALLPTTTSDVRKTHPGRHAHCPKRFVQTFNSG